MVMTGVLNFSNKGCTFSAAQEYLLKFNIQVNGELPGGVPGLDTGGGTPPPTIVDPGSMAPPPPRNGAQSTSSVTWNGDAVFTNSTAALEFVSQMQTNAARNAMSAAAGSSYVG